MNRADFLVPLGAFALLQKLHTCKVPFRLENDGAGKWSARFRDPNANVLVPLVLSTGGDMSLETILVMLADVVTALYPDEEFAKWWSEVPK